MEYWDNLFKNRDKEFLHETELEKNINYLKGKKLLELGAGDGRNSLFLAEKGFDITACDYSTQGIKKLQERAEKKCLSIKIKIVDIEEKKLDVEGFEAVLFIHYFPKVDKFKEIFSELSNNTLVFILTFIKDEVTDNRKTIGISYGEIKEIKNSGRILKEEILEDNRGKSYLLIMEKQ